MGNIILIASGKGGTGKTSASANIGIALAETGRLTVLVDMDMGLRNLDISLGLESSVVYDICDVVDGVCTLDEALVKDDTTENLYLLSAPQTKSAAGFTAESFAPVWESLKNRFDYCIIDAPAGMGNGFLYSLECADMVLTVTIPEISALRDADRLIAAAEGKDVRLILNRIQPRLIEKGLMMNVDDCADMLGVPIIGLVPENYIPLSLGSVPAVRDEKSKAGQAFKNIALRIEGNAVPVMDFDEKEGFLSRFRRLIGGGI